MLAPVSRVASLRAWHANVARIPPMLSATSYRMRYAHSEAKPDAPAKQAGTVFTGLSIYKDKPDPVARPDNEYPSWLWDLLEDPAVKPKKALMVGDVDTTGMSKGEARVALKRAAKMARAAARKQAAEEAKEKARWERMTDAQRAAVTARAKAEKDDKPKTATQMFEQERTKRRELRKANRAAIKASNFVRSA